MSNSRTTSNVPEAQGLRRVELETTAANAQLEAPTAHIAREVEANADHAKDVAHDAASIAKSKGTSLTGNTPSPLDQLQQQASKTLNAAVAEGEHDIGAAKSTTGAEYVDQAKTLAANAISTAQSYLPESVGGQAKSANGTSDGSGAVSSLQSGATTALEATKEYVAALQEAAGPRIEATKEYLVAVQETAKPHIENAKGAVQGYLGTAGMQGVDSPVSPKDTPATSAPHAAGTPHPSATAGTNVGQNKEA